MRNLRGFGKEAAQTTGRLSSVCPSLRTYTAHEVSDRLADRPSLRTYTAHEVSDRLADLIGAVYLDEVAPLHRAFGQQNSRCRPRHSITSSARARSVGGTSRPSAFAVAVFIPQDRLQFCIGLTRL
jgi:hypothetical protein